MKCKGIEASTNDFIEIQGDTVISNVDPVLEAADNAAYIAPGFIDLQVNGFAGVDYNSPVASWKKLPAPSARCSRPASRDSFPP